ncbi:hypothetical protein Leryth_008858 [Lithospermum erythrorhizon]|nr:hypothetical protein Leryth_008858 [Lithospermum erythrorhizon]
MQQCNQPCAEVDVNLEAHSWKIGTWTVKLELLLSEFAPKCLFNWDRHRSFELPLALPTEL